MKNNWHGLGAAFADKPGNGNNLQATSSDVAAYDPHRYRGWGEVMRYAVWNNKGGVGKTFLSFVLATEIAKERGCPVLLVDMCPQANLSEIVLGGNGTGSEKLDSLIKKRKTVGGYFDTRINSPQQKTGNEESFLIEAWKVNPQLPDTVYLIAGDPSLELQAQVISQIGGQTLPVDSWKNVHNWLSDLIAACQAQLGEETMVLIDCNPSFAAYTELAMVAAEALIVPCSSDGSSARAIDNIGALLYGVNKGVNYGAAGFFHKARHAKLALPYIHSVVLNRSMQYSDKASKAFGAMFDEIKNRVKELKKSSGTHFKKTGPIFQDVPDAHSVSIVCSHLGLPLHCLKAKRYHVHDENPKVNAEPLQRYRDSVDLLTAKI